jgi:threonine dehydrogenase-like Zn-dependent dehydrogenase
VVEKLYRYSHLFGGCAGGQAECARIPHAGDGPLRIPDGIAAEQVLFLFDIVLSRLDPVLRWIDWAR